MQCIGLDDALVDRFRELKKAEDEDADAKIEYARVISELDAVYWKRVEEIVTSRAETSDKRLYFSDEERLLIDVGLLDLRLIKNADERFAMVLLKEIKGVKVPGHFYFTEWLEERHAKNIFLHKIEDHAQESKAGGIDEAQLLTNQKKLFQKVFKAIGHLFEQLPGVSKQVSALAKTGMLDLKALAFFEQTLSTSDPEKNEQKEKFELLLNQLTTKAKNRCRDQAQMKMFDTLATLRKKLRSAIVSQARAESGRKNADGQQGESLSSKDKKNFIRGELRLVRSLIPLGAVEGGLRKTHTSLIASTTRITKDTTEKVTRTIMEVDGTIPDEPNILIAPFTGNGFFEWDRDSLVVPLCAVRTPEEAIANAVGNYRILVDNLHYEGETKKSYTKVMGEVNFKKRFLRDYVNWVVNIGSGNKGAMDAKSYKFFKEEIGPNAYGVIVPLEIRKLTMQERQQFAEDHRQHAERGMLTFGDYYKLGVIYWEVEKLDLAREMFKHAARLAPMDGRTLFSLGQVMKKLMARGEAKAFYRDCIKNAAGTIWQIYSNEALARMD